MVTWKKLCTSQQLNLNISLMNGQSFVWKQVLSENEIFHGVIGSLRVQLYQDEQTVYYSTNNGNGKAILKDYFRLSENVDLLYDSWMKKNDNFSAILKALPGLRLLRQPPVECFFTFLCSSNNNISRITKMVDSLRCEYGVALEGNGDHLIYQFPTIKALATRATESRLRELGFGYRASYVVESSKALHKLGGEQFLFSLRENSAGIDIRNTLCQFKGVGSKVADCISLFSLDKLNQIPVDTHVWQIAQREFKYDPKMNSKTITPKLYDHVTQLFQQRFKKHAGWAHSVLFTAELPRFQSLLPKHMQRTIAPKKKKMKSVNLAMEEKSKRLKR